MRAELRGKTGRLLLAMSITLLTVAGAGCTGSGDPGKKLVGTWTGDPTSIFAAQSSISEEQRKALEKMAKEAQPSMKAVYRGDGTFEVSVKMMGMEQKNSGSWKVIEAQEDRLKVETQLGDNKETATLDITFKGADTIEMKSSERQGAIQLTRTKDG